MKYNEMFEGQYIIRLKALAGYKVLSGAICRVNHRVRDKLEVSLTRDCKPIGDPIILDSFADDGFWYDISDLITEVNFSVRPSTKRWAYKDPVVASYRNFVGMNNAQAMDAQDAVGKVCLLGEKTPHDTLVFSKRGYYIVCADVNGFTAAYVGYCDPALAGAADSFEPLDLTILNLTNSGRAFFEAAPIIDACASAFEEDVTAAETFRAEIIREVKADKTTLTVEDDVESALYDLGRVSALEFGGV